MGFFDLFKRKKQEVSESKQLPSQIEIEQAKNLMKQLQECTDFINTTTSPRTFWGRLNLALDILLELQKFEKYDLFRESTPTKDYNKIIGNLEATVNDFIDRVIITQSEKNELLSSQNEKDKKMKRCIENLWNSFYEASDYWQGNNMYPHYTGKLYVESSLQRVEDILQDLTMKEIQKPITPTKTINDTRSPIPCTISFHSSESYKRYEEKIVEQFIEEDKNNADSFAKNSMDIVLKQARALNHDLVVMSNFSGGCCSECAKQSGRLYSLTGKSEGYPKIPNYVKEHGNFHRGCWCSMNIYFEGFSISFLGNHKIDAEESTKRPWVDNRTQEQINWHENRYKNRISEAQEFAAREFDRKEYEAIQKALPDIAPKSFSAYRRMKNGNTAGFQKILALVQTVEK